MLQARRAAYEPPVQRNGFERRAVNHCRAAADSADSYDLTNAVRRGLPLSSRSRREAADLQLDCRAEERSQFPANWRAGTLIPSSWARCSRTRDGRAKRQTSAGPR